LLLGLPDSSRIRAQQSTLPGDPIEDLRRALNPAEPLFSSYNNAEERTKANDIAREKQADALKELAKSLTARDSLSRSLGSLSRALLLPEWQTLDDKLGRDDPDQKKLIDNEVRKPLIERFSKGLEESLSSNDPPRVIAAASVLGEFFLAAWALPKPPTEILGALAKLTPLLKAQTEHPDCQVRAAAVVALTRVAPKTEDIGPVYRKRLADPEVFVRRATARALREQIRSLVRRMMNPGGLSGAKAGAEGPLLAPSRDLEKDRQDFYNLALLLLEDLIAQPCTGLSDKDGAVRYNSAAIFHEIARGLRALVTSDNPVPIVLDAKTSISPAGDFAEFVRPLGSKLRLAPDRPELPLGRKLTAEDVARLKTLQMNIRKFVLEPSLKLFQAFRNAAPQLACVVLDDDFDIRLEARQTLEQLAGSRTRARYLRDVLGIRFQPAPAKKEDEAPKGVGIFEVMADEPTGVSEASAPFPTPGGSFRSEVRADKTSTGADKENEKFLASISDRFQEPTVTTEALVKGMCVPFPDIRTSVAAAEALEAMGDAGAAAIPGLLKGLTNPNLFVRWACTRTLGKLAPSEPNLIVPALIPGLCDPDVDLAETAAKALERYGVLARSAIPTLIKLVAQGDPDVRIAVIRALVATGSAGAVAVPELARNLTDSNKRVKLQSIQALAVFGPLAKEAACALRDAAFNDTDGEVRREASDALIKVLGD